MSAAFATTRWTLVVAAASAFGPALEPEARRALSELCRLYRPPLLAHARRRGLSAADAEDCVQGLLESLISRDSLPALRPERGRFRSWLLGAFEHHLSDVRARSRAAKRGGVQPHASDPEAALDDRPSPDLSPDAAYDRAWALAVLKTTTERLRAEHAAEAREAFFDALAPALAGRDADHPHSAIAARFDLTEPALRVALHRLRQRYRQTLRAVVSETVENPEDIDAELRHLIAALGDG